MALFKKSIFSKLSRLTCISLDRFLSPHPNVPLGRQQYDITLTSIHQKSQHLQFRSPSFPALGPRAQDSEGRPGLGVGGALGNNSSNRTCGIQARAGPLSKRSGRSCIPASLSCFVTQACYLSDGRRGPPSSLRGRPVCCYGQSTLVALGGGNTTSASSTRPFLSLVAGP